MGLVPCLDQFKCPCRGHNDTMCQVESRGDGKQTSKLLVWALLLGFNDTNPIDAFNNKNLHYISLYN